MIWWRPRTRVLFVCTANVCRSPLAEALLRHRLRSLHLGRDIEVRSAGTRVAQRGRHPDPRLHKLLAETPVSLSGIRARPLTPRLLERSHYVFVMEQRHLHEARQLYVAGRDHNQEASPGSPPLLAQLQCLGHYLPGDHGSPPDIPDPYYSNWPGFVHVYQMIDLAVTALAEHLAEQHNFQLR